MFPTFAAFIPILFVCAMDRKNPDKRTNNKSDILSTHSQQSGELGYLYSIGEDEKKTLDEEMWEAILYVQRFELGKIRTKNWQCQKVKKIYLAICNEWKKRWTSLTVYLSYYSEFGRSKVGTKIIKALKKEKNMDKQLFRKKLPEKFEEAGILDHLALKPHFKACADGSMITFTEAIEQCLAAYKFLFSVRNRKFCQIYKFLCANNDGPNDAQIQPSSDFVNERECIFVNEWVRAYKRANNFEDNDPRLGARQLLSSIVPLVENDAPIPPETLKMIPLQLMSATYRRAV